MKRRLTVLGLLLLGTILLLATGLLKPKEAFAFCDATISGSDCDLNDDGGTGGGTGGGGGWTDPCRVQECQTTYTGPLGVECCCLYVCRSGNTWVCRQGVYCPA